MRDSEKKSLRTESLWTLKYFNQDLSFRAGNCWICNGISQCFTLKGSQTFINSALHFYTNPYLIKIPLVFSAILIPRKCNSNTKKSNLKCQLSFLSCTNKFHFMTKSAVWKTYINFYNGHIHVFRELFLKNVNNKWTLVVPKEVWSLPWLFYVKCVTDSEHHLGWKKTLMCPTINPTLPSSSLTVSSNATSACFLIAWSEDNSKVSLAECCTAW